MKKVIFAIVPLAIMFMSSCAGGDETEEVRLFAINFAEKISKNQVDSVKTLYPELAICDSFALSFTADSIGVIKSEEGKVFTVKFSSKADMTVVKDEDGKLTIKESHGLVAYPAAKLKFAKGTGWFDKTLNDAQNAERLADTLFENMVKSKILDDIKTKVKIKVKSANFGSDYSKVICKIVVANESDLEISGDAYSVRSSLFPFFKAIDINSEGFYGDTPSDSRTLTGKAIPPHGTAEYTYTTEVFSIYIPGDLRCKLMLNTSHIDIMSIFKPTGKEYEEYLKAKTSGR
jgi:hypothetical protein